MKNSILPRKLFRLFASDGIFRQLNCFTFQVTILKHGEHARRVGRPSDVGGIAGEGVEARPAIVRENVVLVRECRKGHQFCSPRSGGESVMIAAVWCRKVAVASQMVARREDEEVFVTIPTVIAMTRMAGIAVVR